MSIIDQLEEFKEYIDNFTPTIVSNIDMRRKYYQTHPAEAKKNDLYSKSTDLFKNIVVAALQINNKNANVILKNIEDELSQNELEQNMWDELIKKITNSIVSSNLTISNTKENHAKLISIIEKYNAGFLNKFILSQNVFSIEMLDCFLYIYMNFKDIEEEILNYLRKNNKDSLTELLKFMNISVTEYKNLYQLYVKDLTNISGYMKYIIDEIEKLI